MSDEPITEDAASGEASAKLNDGKHHATQAVHDRGRAEHAYSEARNRAQSLRGESEQWIRENPTRAVLTAMGVGFILGLMFRK
jgi:ElaB/YqjD/DUF883 family membrane-anchored ribosome-binding protein